MMGGARFMNSHLDNVSFWCADLSRADLRAKSLKNTNFTRATLTDAIFTNADLNGTNFKNAKLKRTDFLGAVNLNKKNFEGACADEQPKFDPSVQMHFQPCGKQNQCPP